MTDLLSNEPVPLGEQILCVEREIRMRQKVYSGFVSRGKMKLDRAEREIEVMQAVLATLRRLQEHE
jgi:hypothetical protein